MNATYNTAARALCDGSPFAGRMMDRRLSELWQDGASTTDPRLINIGIASQVANALAMRCDAMRMKPDHLRAYAWELRRLANEHEATFIALIDDNSPAAAAQVPQQQHSAQVLRELSEHAYTVTRYAIAAQSQQTV